MTEVHAVPDWVWPSAVEVFDLKWLAYRRYLDAPHEIDRQRGETIAATVRWVWGPVTGPATGRPDQPVTRPVAVAEMWAAMALADGGGTRERVLRGVCAEQGMRYYPPDFGAVGLEAGMAIYQALSWLLASPDGWERGRRPPLEIPLRDAAGSVADDPRSRELAEFVVETRGREAAALRR